MWDNITANISNKKYIDSNPYNHGITADMTIAGEGIQLVKCKSDGLIESNVS